MKLTIELVPSTSFYNNVRSNVTSERWDIIRKKSYKYANYRCEICKSSGKSQGYNHPVECHEIWSYDDDKLIQKLDGLISLCPLCHKTKHVGLAQLNGEIDLVINHLSKVNSISREESVKYINESFKIWNQRSQFKWNLDISYINTY